MNFSANFFSISSEEFLQKCLKDLFGEFSKLFLWEFHRELLGDMSFSGNPPKNFSENYSGSFRMIFLRKFLGHSLEPSSDSFTGNSSRNATFHRAFFRKFLREFFMDCLWGISWMFLRVSSSEN